MKYLGAEIYTDGKNKFRGWRTGVLAWVDRLPEGEDPEHYAVESFRTNRNIFVGTEADNILQEIDSGELVFVDAGFNPPSQSGERSAYVKLGRKL